MDLAGQQQFRAKLKLLKLQDLRFQEERLHGKKKRRMNTDMEDKYENEDEKKKAEQEIEDQAKAFEELTLDWRKAKALYRQTEQALKEAKDRSWCTIS